MTETESPRPVNRPTGPRDLKAAAGAVATLLEAFGFRAPVVQYPGIVDTPERVARAYAELLDGYVQDPAKILSKRFAEWHDELIVVRNIPFSSLCEHHLLPFSGTVSVGYLPKGEVVGLSKIPRLVRCFSRRLQIQERLTSEIAHAIYEHLDARFAGCIVRSHHQCMSLRGVASAGDMVTSAMYGPFRDQLKSEFLRLAE